MGAVLSVEVIGGSDAETVAGCLRQLDSSDLLQVQVSSVPRSEPPAFALVIATPSAVALNVEADIDAVVDLVLSAREGLDRQVTRLYDRRISAFAAALTGEKTTNSPAEIHPPDPAWKVMAARYMDRVQIALRPWYGEVGCLLEHIGSTSVPGLSAKPIIDLQLQVPELRHDAGFDAALHGAGFFPTTGSRPDSPGVYRDGLVGPATVDTDVLAKRLFVRPDPGHEAILHIRKDQSPWARYTVRFRDLLRDQPAERRRYETLKYDLAAAHSKDADYDDYTRAKGAYFADVIANLE